MTEATDSWTVVAARKVPKKNPYANQNDRNDFGNKAAADTQDWKDVVFKKRVDNYKQPRAKDMREGNFVTINKESRNQARQYDGRHMAKLENETEDFHHKRVDKKWSKAIQVARNAKHMSQKELAQKMNVTVDVIANYEKGTAIPEGAVLQQFKRVLGI